MLHTFKIYEFEGDYYVANHKKEVNPQARLVDRVRSLKGMDIIPFNLPKDLGYIYCPSFDEYVNKVNNPEPKPVSLYKDDVEKEIENWLNIMVMYSPSEFLKKYFPFRMADMIAYSGYPNGSTLRRYYKSKPKLFILLALGIKQIKEFKNG